MLATINRKTSLYLSGTPDLDLDLDLRWPDQISDIRPHSHRMTNCQWGEGLSAEAAITGIVGQVIWPVRVKINWPVSVLIS